MQGSSSVSGRVSPPVVQQTGAAALNLPGSNPGVGTSAAAAGVQQVGAINPGVNPQGSSTDASARLGASSTVLEGNPPANA